MLANLRSKKVIAATVLTLIAFVMLWLLVPSGVVPDPTNVVPDVLTAVPDTYRPETVSFSVQVKDLPVPYRVFGLFVMPGETVDIETVFDSDGRSANVRAAAGKLEEIGEYRWRWTAPEVVGWYPITVNDPRTGEAIRLNAFVMVPYDARQESISGFRVGRYPARPRRNNPIFTRPKGFIQVTEDNKDVLVSPHFTIGQFTSKQTVDYPKYLVLNEKLPLKLEAILQRLNESGIHANTFHVMSGYRTPHYNALIGNETDYSLHLYGAAADIFVDMEEDEYMDDLNGDGDVTTEDAQVMADIVEAMRQDPAHNDLIGGLGVYSPASHRGPFIHVDVRGQMARW